MRKIALMAHLPSFYHEVAEFQQLFGSLDQEFIQIYYENEKDLLDAFVMTADESSIGIWEKEIGIIPDLSNEDLDFRKARLINRYTIKPPFTIVWMERQLKNLLKEQFLRCERDDEVEILTVYADLSSLPILREFESTIEAVLPLSMQFQKCLSAYRKATAKFYAGAACSAMIQQTVKMSS